MKAEQCVQGTGYKTMGKTDSLIACLCHYICKKRVEWAFIFFLSTRGQSCCYCLVCVIWTLYVFYLALLCISIKARQPLLQLHNAAWHGNGCKMFIFCCNARLQGKRGAQRILRRRKENPCLLHFHTAVLVKPANIFYPASVCPCKRQGRIHMSRFQFSITKVELLLFFFF